MAQILKASGQVLFPDRFGQGGAGSLATASAFATADTLPGTSYGDVTGCTLTLSAGTWFVYAVANLVNTSGIARISFVKLYNFTDTVDLAGESNELSAGGFSGVLTPQVFVTLAATKTIRLAAKTSFATAVTIQRYSEGTIPATYINAIQTG